MYLTTTVAGKILELLQENNAKLIVYLSAECCFLSFACRNGKCQVKFIFLCSVTILHYHWHYLSAGASQPGSRLPNSSHSSPDGQWSSGSSLLPSLHLLRPPAWEAAGGDGPCVSIRSLKEECLCQHLPQEHRLEEAATKKMGKSW